MQSAAKHLACFSEPIVLIALRGKDASLCSDRSNKSWLNQTASQGRRNQLKAAWYAVLGGFFMAIVGIKTKLMTD
jgi:hypothetical protein